MEKKLNIDHIFIQIIYFMTAALTYAFGTYTMLSRGVSSSTIGILIAIGDLLAISLQAVISNFLDKSNKVNTVQMTLIISFALLLVSIVNYILNDPSIALYISYIFYQAFVAILMTLFNQLSSSFANAGLDINFGIARAFGSLSFALTCFLYGYISESLGYKTVTASLILFQVLIIIVLVITNKHFDIKESQRAKLANIPFKEFISNHKLFIVTCIGYALIMCGYNASENFMLPIIENVGGTNLDASIVSGLKAIFEIPIIYNYSKIEKRIKPKTIFLISGISFTIKAAVLYFATSTLPIYISQALQATSFAFLLPATISYIDKIMSQKELSRGHSMQSILQTIAGMSFNSLAGNIIDNSGVNMFCLVSTITTLVGTIIITASIKNNKAM